MSTNNLAYKGYLIPKYPIDNSVRAICFLCTIISYFIGFGIYSDTKSVSALLFGSTTVFLVFLVISKLYNWLVKFDSKKLAEVSEVSDINKIRVLGELFRMIRRRVEAQGYFYNASGFNEGLIQKIDVNKVFEDFKIGKEKLVDNFINRNGNLIFFLEDLDPDLLEHLFRVAQVSLNERRESGR